MKICHFSDWHWKFRSLPEADLYICTGDMYLNYPVQGPALSGWGINLARESKFQLIDSQTFVKDGGFRRWLGSPDSPIVCVRGNHDFIDLSHLFDGCNLVHEFINNESVDVLGMKITGHRGIPFIQGTWSDEISRDALHKRVQDMPDADIFVTHYAPFNTLDCEVMARGRIERYGLEGMRELLTSKMGDRGLHCFGHIHGSGGIVKEFGSGSLIGGSGPIHTYSNAACNINVIEI